MFIEMITGVKSGFDIIKDLKDICTYSEVEKIIDFPWFANAQDTGYLPKSSSLQKEDTVESFIQKGYEIIYKFDKKKRTKTKFITQKYNERLVVMDKKQE